MVFFQNQSKHLECQNKKLYSILLQVLFSSSVRPPLEDSVQATEDDGVDGVGRYLSQAAERICSE